MYMGCPKRIELLQPESQSSILTVKLWTPLERNVRIELTTTDWKSVVLPLN